MSVGVSASVGVGVSGSFGVSSFNPSANLGAYFSTRDALSSIYQGWNGMAGGVPYGALSFAGAFSQQMSNPFAALAQISMMFTLLESFQSQMMMCQCQNQPRHDYNYQMNYQPPAPTQNYTPAPTPAPVSYHEPTPAPVAYGEPTPPPAPVAHPEPTPPPVEYHEPTPPPAPEPEPEPVKPVRVEQEVHIEQVVHDFGGGGDGDGDGDGDPVMLDLNGDGKLDVGGKDSAKISFDLFGNGTDVKTEWLKEGTEDGLLVADFNGDGKIDSGRELFRTTGVDGEQGKYTGGWDKLSQLFDKDQDGKVSEQELEGLLVWVDKNADGISDPGELQTVQSLGVTEIQIPPAGELVSNFTMNGKKEYAEDYIFDIEVNR